MRKRDQKTWKYLVGISIFRSIDWLTNFLVQKFIADWLIDWLTALWLIDRLIKFICIIEPFQFIDWLIDELVYWSLIDWLIEVEKHTWCDKWSSYPAAYRSGWSAARNCSSPRPHTATECPITAPQSPNCDPMGPPDREDSICPRKCIFPSGRGEICGNNLPTLEISANVWSRSRASRSRPRGHFRDRLRRPRRCTERSGLGGKSEFPWAPSAQCWINRKCLLLYFPVKNLNLKKWFDVWKEKIKRTKNKTRSKESMRQSIKQSIDQSFKQSIKRSINQSIDLQSKLPFATRSRRKPSCPPLNPTA